MKYSGEPEELHGHNYTVRACVSGERLDPRGMVVDFLELDKVLGRVLKSLDHKYLNDVLNLSNPTAELIAEYIFRELRKVFSDLTSVEVCETDRYCAEVTT